MKNGSVGYLIDLDADPFIPNGWSAVEHIKGGNLSMIRQR